MRWHKITSKRLPPLDNNRLLFYNINKRGYAMSGYANPKTTFRGYIDNGLTHWAYLTLPQ